MSGYGISSETFHFLHAAAAGLSDRFVVRVSGLELLVDADAFLHSNLLAVRFAVLITICFAVLITICFAVLITVCFALVVPVRFALVITILSDRLFI